MSDHKPETSKVTSTRVTPSKPMSSPIMPSRRCVFCGKAYKSAHDCDERIALQFDIEEKWLLLCRGARIPETLKGAVSRADSIRMAAYVSASKQRSMEEREIALRKENEELKAKVEELTSKKRKCVDSLDEEEEATCVVGWKAIGTPPPPVRTPCHCLPVMTPKPPST